MIKWLKFLFLLLLKPAKLHIRIVYITRYLQIRFLFSGSKKPKPTPSAPSVEMHAASDSTIKTAHRLPSYHSQTSHSTANPNQLLPPQTRSHRSETNKTVPTILKVVHHHDPLWDLHEINRFTRDIFKFKHGNILSEIFFLSHSSSRSSS